VAGALVFGDINVDLLARFDSEPDWGLDNLVSELVQQCGGVGANVAVALARWDVPARLVGCVGRDAFGDFALRFLESKRVETAFVQRTDHAPTGVIFITVHPGGQRTIFGARGANALAARPDAKCMNGIEAVHLVGYNFLSPGGADAAWSLLDEAHRRDARVALDVGMDPSRRIAGILLEAARRVDILFVGMGEALALTRAPDEAEALARLKDCGAAEVVVKRGEAGSQVLDGGAWRDVPAFRVESRDTTGSGDAFAAAYLRARMQKWTPAEAALVANAAGAAAATVLGAGESMPSPETVARLIATADLDSTWKETQARVLERLPLGAKVRE
jgi:sugar/nucleoside kinase (ribokinase family)